MLIETFQTEEEYLKYVRNILLFTHLRCYNGQCQIWKDEDYSFIKNIDDKNIRENDIELFKKSFDVYKKASAEYGDTVVNNRDNYSNLNSSDILTAFGLVFDPENDDNNNYVASDLDVNLVDLTKNENYPKSFPVITIQGDGDFKCEHIYPEDFKKQVKIDDFSWLEKNIRDFWEKGKGSFYGV